ncbi:hypothetical protein [Streptomyces sp. NBC_01497]|uniref:hypothetical protein n=1 Tax=Streptomyces sp. NBC_01497 TaxID=2903885 RepID=UPI002E3709BA|nr:hypothetical protein [Streptomyces sp. NBC_01497]
MPSVIGLLEERERSARQRVEVLREEADQVLAELRDAELSWERFVTAREVLVEMLTGPGGGAAVEETAVPVAQNTAPTPMGMVGRVPGSVVPVRDEGVGVSALSPDHRRIVWVLAAPQVALACGEIASALGLEHMPTKVEGVRSKAARMAERAGWSRSRRGRSRSCPGCEAAGHEHGH